MLDNKQKKVIIAMSGGVDSSVSAWLLQQQGYLVEGLFMKNWEEEDNEKYCISTRDLADAKSVCDVLNIKLHTINFSAEYWDKVFTNFLIEYQSGKTPNPDVLCNKEIKFKVFLELAIEDLNSDFIATGHYVRHIKTNNNSLLLRGVDNNKDQSYFLYTLGHKQLIRCLFPIGGLTKSNVRYIAAKLGLVTANKKDSTGICFIGKRKFRDFIGRYLPEKPGMVISVSGEKMGYHRGLMYYTIGQRKGLGIGGKNKYSNKPWYVVDKNINENTLIIAQGCDNPWLMSSGFIANKLNWIDQKIFKNPLRCTVKTRYRQVDIACLLTPLPNKRLQVTFDQPVIAVTPGQSAVFYISERCLGGGIIEKCQPFLH